MQDQTEVRLPRKYVYRRPWLYPKQLSAIFDPRDRSGEPARYSLIEASTKTGKTVGCVTWLFEQAYLGKAGQNFWWIAPVYGQAEIAYRRMKLAMPSHLFVSHEGHLRHTLLNGCAVWFKSGDQPDNLYGEDVYAAVMDEASRSREEAFHAVRSTLTATRGPIRIIGNIKGRKNWFYALARKAEAGEPSMSYHKIVAGDAVAAGVLHDDEVADAKRVLPDAVFRELYLSEPSDDEGNPFGHAAIRACLVPSLSPKPPVAWGWDLAKSVDWTVGIGLDRDGAVCRFHRFQKPWRETMDTIARETGRTPALVDSTGVGDPIVEDLQRGRSNVVGYHFTQPSKQKLMEGLAVAIQRSEVRFPEGLISSECEQFEYMYTRTGVRYSAPPGFNDDCVCALALARECKTERRDIDVWLRAAGR